MLVALMCPGAAAPPRKSETVAPKESTDPPPKADPPTPTKDDKGKRDRSSWMRMAKNYIANNMPDKAKPILIGLLLEHPASPSAPEARDLLATLD